MLPQARRIAIIGGDGRSEKSTTWPEGFDLRFYASQGDGGSLGLKSFAAAHSSGSTKFAIILTKWVGHGFQEYIRKNHIDCELWKGSVNELAGALPQIAFRHGVVPVVASRKEADNWWEHVLVPQAGSKGTLGKLISDAFKATSNPEVKPMENVQPVLEPEFKDRIPMIKPLPVTFGQPWTEEELVAFKTAYENAKRPKEIIAAFRTLMPESKRSNDSITCRISKLHARNKKAEIKKQHAEVLLRTMNEATKPRPVCQPAHINPDSFPVLVVDTIRTHGPITASDLTKLLQGTRQFKNMYATLNYLWQQGKIKRVQGTGSKLTPFKYVLNTELEPKAQVPTQAKTKPQPKVQSKVQKQEQKQPKTQTKTTSTEYRVLFINNDSIAPRRFDSLPEALQYMSTVAEQHPSIKPELWQRVPFKTRNVFTVDEDRLN